MIEQEIELIELLCELRKLIKKIKVTTQKVSANSH